MIENLLIVESPNKAKTIQNYLGNTFQVESCFGHISDLPKNNIGINIENNFQPEYIVLKEKIKIIEKLKSLVNKSKNIWLATDKDREGEAISWHLYRELSIKKDQIKRITFNEITKKAIIEAINNPRLINENLVNAQQARRIVDRLVGFKLSPILWKKIQTGLSAGRVQSIAVRLIVEKEEEIEAFNSKFFYKILAIFTNKYLDNIECELNKKLYTRDDVEHFLKSYSNKIYKISNILLKKYKKSPSPPFTTSTLQQEAYNKLNYSISRTMYLSQKLYEKGFITYMRTDNVIISNNAIEDIKSYIIELYGLKYLNIKKYINKNKSSQEAHEAIRPTNIKVKDININDKNQKNLYKLIWERTVSSQMSDMILEKTIIHIDFNSKNYKFISNEINKIIFQGFNKIKETNIQNNNEKKYSIHIYNNDNNDDNSLIIKKIYAIQKFSKYPSRYSEATLVKKLENLGIGRPSTYVPIISTIQKRNYVEIKSNPGLEKSYEIINIKNNIININFFKKKFNYDNNKMSPTNIGIMVNNFLKQYFYQIMDYNFTAKIEKNFDEIANGQKKWNKIIEIFYKKFQNTINEVNKNVERINNRFLGLDPISGEKVWVKMGKFGPIIQIGESNNKKKPKFIPLLKNQKINSICLNDILFFLKLPKILGLFNNIEISTNIGIYGPYIKYGKEYFSIDYENNNIINPTDITLDKAIEIIEKKNKEREKNIICSFDNINPSIKILNGKYGPYIRYNKKNFKLSKNIDLKNITLDQCKNIISKSKKK